MVHVNAGIAALVAALVLGKRKGFPTTPMPPHNLATTVTGACMLWVGWFGFNAGSALAANGDAGMAMLVTHLGAAAGSSSEAHRKGLRSMTAHLSSRSATTNRFSGIFWLSRG